MDQLFFRALETMLKNNVVHALQKLHSNEHMSSFFFPIHNTHLFSKVLLNIYYVLGIVSNARDRIVNKANKSPTFKDVTVSEGKLKLTAYVT